MIFLLTGQGVNNNVQLAWPKLDQEVIAQELADPMMLRNG
jgi:hypothetical protein